MRLINVDSCDFYFDSIKTVKNTTMLKKWKIVITLKRFLDGLIL